ncbi:hypothetical protein F8388_010016 [Cannabis sativa]|uniref:Uncharacterized protein n=1 Tax=Cannabis sativa TaxID=3483 RepID=A0A7J6E620_CANSA|nr:hypothetical protein F8388_010016 [Cannabis sativa]
MLSLSSWEAKVIAKVEPATAKLTPLGGKKGNDSDCATKSITNRPSEYRFVGCENASYFECTRTLNRTEVTPASWTDSGEHHRRRRRK